MRRREVDVDDDEDEDWDDDNKDEDQDHDDEEDGETLFSPKTISYHDPNCDNNSGCSWYRVMLLLLRHEQNFAKISPSRTHQNKRHTQS